MWDNMLGIGSYNLQATDKVEIIPADMKPDKKISAAFGTSFIFGYFLSSINNLYHCFGTGLSLGGYSALMSYGEYVIDGIGIYVGLPLDEYHQNKSR